MSSPFLYLVIKAALSGVVIAVASEVARRLPALGALILSPPLVSILAFCCARALRSGPRSEPAAR